MIKSFIFEKFKGFQTHPERVMRLKESKFCLK